jgi:hypothetical protein
VDEEGKGKRKQEEEEEGRNYCIKAEKTPDCFPDFRKSRAGCYPHGRGEERREIGGEKRDGRGMEEGGKRKKWKKKYPARVDQ